MTFGNRITGLILIVTMAGVVILGVMIGERLTPAASQMAVAQETSVTVVEVMAGERLCYLAYERNNANAGDDIELLWCK